TESAAATTVAAGAGDPCRGELERRADLVDLDLVHRALLALTGLERALAEPTVDDHPHALLEGLRHALGGRRQTLQVRHNASPSTRGLDGESNRRGVEAMRKLETAAPDGVHRSSGSATMFPTTVLGVSPCAMRLSSV